MDGPIRRNESPAIAAGQLANRAPQRKQSHFSSAHSIPPTGDIAAMSAADTTLWCEFAAQQAGPTSPAVLRPIVIGYRGLASPLVHR